MNRTVPAFGSNIFITCSYWSIYSTAVRREFKYKDWMFYRLPYLTISTIFHSIYLTITILYLQTTVAEFYTKIMKTVEVVIIISSLLWPYQPRQSKFSYFVISSSTFQPAKIPYKLNSENKEMITVYEKTNEVFFQCDRFTKRECWWEHFNDSRLVTGKGMPQKTVALWDEWENIALST